MTARRRHRAGSGGSARWRPIGVAAIPAAHAGAAPATEDRPTAGLDAGRPGGRRAPGPLAAIGVAAGVMAFSTDHPAVLLALAAGALALFLTAPGRPSRLYLVGGAVIGGGLLVLTPLVASEGDLILVRGPAIPILDLEVTVEELAFGAAAGLRTVCVTVLVGALLAHVDADRMQARVARVAPRSAMTLALAVRLLPTLERDARAISEAARLRGLDLAAGGRLRRARAASGLVLPLLGSSLERGLDVAEAMAARGYGAGRRTHLAERRYDGVERAVLALGLLLGVVAAGAWAGGSTGYSYYPTLASPLAPAALTVAAGALTALAGACALLRR